MNTREEIEDALYDLLRFVRYAQERVGLSEVEDDMFMTDLSFILAVNDIVDHARILKAIVSDWERS